jgi:hypothetical protein
MGQGALEPFPTVEITELEFRDPPRLVWVPVREAVQLLWRDNPKLHDIGGLADSINTHGYQSSAKFDVNLPRVGQSDKQKPLGAIKAGNGRLETLDWMEKQGWELPRGLGRRKSDGAWAVWVLCGTDAESEALAMAYAIDDNNLVLDGGPFTAWEKAKLWDEESYLKVLASLTEQGVRPISVDLDDIEALLDQLPDGFTVDFSAFSPVANPVIRYRVIVDGLDLDTANSLAQGIEDARVEQYREIEV